MSEYFDKAAHVRDDIYSTAPDILKKLCNYDPWVVALACAEDYYRNAIAGESTEQRIKQLYSDGRSSMYIADCLTVSREYVQKVVSEIVRPDAPPILTAPSDKERYFIKGLSRRKGMSNAEIAEIVNRTDEMVEQIVEGLYDRKGKSE